MDYSEQTGPCAQVGIVWLGLRVEPARQINQPVLVQWGMMTCEVRVQEQGILKRDRTIGQGQAVELVQV